MTTVPFFRPSVGDAEIAAVTECLRSGWLTTGAQTHAFEESFAEYVGAKFAVAVNSCTAALHLALEAIGLQRDELVLLPTLTFAATAEVVMYFGATPVFVDCEPETLCIDVNALEQTLQMIAQERPIAGLQPPYGRVRALLPVHYAGQMADVGRIRALAKQYNVAMIEDAAHTLPASYRSSSEMPWQKVGSTADVTCFSFYANKCITTGEGGMAVTDDPALAKRIRMMSLHGLSKDAWRRFRQEGNWYYEILAAGYKYNMTDIAAALGREQLKRAENLWQERRAIVDFYHAQLGHIPGIILPKEIANRQHSWHLFSCRVDPKLCGTTRDDLIEALRKRGVATSVHWMPLHLHPFYRDKYAFAPGTFAVAERIWPQLISLPLFPGMTEAEQHQVVASIRDATNSVAA